MDALRCWLGYLQKHGPKLKSTHRTLFANLLPAYGTRLLSRLQAQHVCSNEGTEMLILFNYLDFGKCFLSSLALCVEVNDLTRHSLNLIRYMPAAFLFPSQCLVSPPPDFLLRGGR